MKNVIKRESPVHVMSGLRHYILGFEEPALAVVVDPGVDPGQCEQRNMPLLDGRPCLKVPKEGAQGTWEGT
ncbi:hypothetical protein ACJZ2D_003543 [Fusarium nematophilum]